MVAGAGSRHNNVVGRRGRGRSAPEDRFRSGTGMVNFHIRRYEYESYIVSTVNNFAGTNIYYPYPSPLAI
jgi:hypothetical protein